jgi:hypothetical protein
MGFFKALHYAIDPKGAAELDQKHTQSRQRGPSLLSEIFANRRANRASDRYWRESKLIDSVYQVPLSHRGMDLGHPPGCTCRWCGG